MRRRRRDSEQRSLFAEGPVRRAPPRAETAAPHRATVPLSELSRVVGEEYDRLDPEMKGRYGPAALLDHIATHLAEPYRSDVKHASYLKRASLEAVIEQRQRERRQWVTAGGRIRKRRTKRSLYED